MKTREKLEKVFYHGVPVLVGIFFGGTIGFSLGGYMMHNIMDPIANYFVVDELQEDLQILCQLRQSRTEEVLHRFEKRLDQNTSRLPSGASWAELEPREQKALLLAKTYRTAYPADMTEDQAYLNARRAFKYMPPIPENLDGYPKEIRANFLPALQKAHQNSKQSVVAKD